MWRSRAVIIIRVTTGAQYPERVSSRFRSAVTVLYDKYTRIQKCSSDFYFYRGKTKNETSLFRGLY